MRRCRAVRAPYHPHYHLRAQLAMYLALYNGNQLHISRTAEPGTTEAEPRRQSWRGPDSTDSGACDGNIQTGYQRPYQPTLVLSVVHLAVRALMLFILAVRAIRFIFAMGALTPGSDPVLFRRRDRRMPCVTSFM